MPNDRNHALIFLIKKASLEPDIDNRQSLIRNLLGGTCFRDINVRSESFIHHTLWPKLVENQNVDPKVLS